MKIECVDCGERMTRVITTEYNEHLLCENPECLTIIRPVSP